MRGSVVLGVIGLAVLTGSVSGQAQSGDRLNRMIPLIEQGLPILGIQNPAYAAGGGGGGAGRAGGRGGAAGAAGAGAQAGQGAQGATAAPATPPVQPNLADAARELVSYTLGDYVLNSFSNATVDRYREFMKAIVAAGGSARTHPFVAKVPIVHRNPETAQQQIIAQLNEGQVSIEMQEVETVEEVDQAIAASRFVSKGGIRPESGFENAAAYWGMTPAEYLQKADVWPLNPNGELLVGVIIESRAGVANARAIAAHPGVAVVTLGAGTLGGVFTTTNADGTRTRDQAGFDAAVAQVLAACKEFKKSCGYPANNPAEVETLMKAGWDFMIMQRRDQNAFDAVLTGRRLSGRPLTP